MDKPEATERRSRKAATTAGPIPQGKAWKGMDSMARRYRVEVVVTQTQVAYVTAPSVTVAHDSIRYALGLGAGDMETVEVEWENPGSDSATDVRFVDTSY